MNSVFETKIDPEDSIVFYAVVLRAPVSTIEKIKKEFLKGRAELIYQKISGAYLFITDKDPREVKT